MPVEEFHYRLFWRARGQHPGFHRGTQPGLGFDYRGLVPLLAAGDPRRLDLRASARDPFRQLLVRTYRQRSAVSVYALADLSASMGFRGAGRKLDIAADFIDALGYAAFRTGDPVAFIGCDAQIRPEFTQALGGGRAAGQALAARLREYEPRSDTAAALVHAAAGLPGKRALVFVLSDYYLQLDLIDALLARLTPHEIVPIVLRDSAELALPRFGLLRVRDAESGKTRHLLARRALSAAIAARMRAHEQALAGRFAAAGARALTFVDRFDAALVTRHFYG